MFKYFLYRITQHLIHILPPSWALSFALFISDLQYCFSPRDRKAVSNNLKCILSDSSNFSHQTREVFRSFGRYLCDFFLTQEKVDQEFIRQRVRLENFKAVEDVLKKNHGCILLTGHIGNWEMGAAVISTLGHPITAIALPHKERPVNDLFNHQREMKGVKVVPTSTAVRQCIEDLRNNRIVAVVGDRDFNNHGEVMDFLGKKALIPKGPAVFSIKTQAPIVPCFLLYDQQGNYVFKFYDPIDPPVVVEEQNMEDAMLTMMKQYLRIIEDTIRQYPTQWLMFREFWVK
jgi:KDO2-lipid IV(A) lauroyltransferase